MSQTANVKSLQSIANFRAALIKFATDIGNGLATQRLELNRATEWLNHERPSYWQQKVQQGWTDVTERRSDLQRCQLRTVAGQRPGCQDEKDALEKAKRDVRHAEEMIDVVRHWCQTMQHETLEYEGRLSGLAATCETEIPKALATLDRIMKALEGYASTQVASAEPSPGRTTEVAGQGPEKSIEAAEHRTTGGENTDE